ncbi:hypothetical protein GH741_07870 [Aquibacillus halophilus]|uniref:YneQ n=1 Tax=Aquibacillus halophilus TaxID=930132 RepID=A0A6A8DBC8_9BACI|nr:hypothetical protein [Aquibacillus halophilus]MRH42600.1 hypothetical protein [Aquibacillus halophilus]
MAFGIKKNELKTWKQQVENGEVVFLTHYWFDIRFPECNTVTKVGCSDIDKLIEWGKKYNLNPKWIHLDESYPHFDLLGDRQKYILAEEKQWDQIKRFNL